MDKMSDQVKENLSQSLLGRLKLKLFEEMTGKKYYISDKRQHKSFLLKHTQSSAYSANCLINILNIKSNYNVKYSDIDTSFNLNVILQELEIYPLENTLFIQINECPEDFPQGLGFLVECQEINDKSDSGYLYRLILISEESFLKGFSGVFEIRASKNNPNPMFSTFVDCDWQTFNIQNYDDGYLSTLVFQILNFIVKITRPQKISKENISHGRFFPSPPVDDQLIKLLKSAKIGIINCSIAEIPLSLIVPYDIDFCLSYPLEIVEKFNIGQELKKTIQNIPKNRLLVYWNENHFVMSDDYPTYLSYRSLNIESIPCVVLGKYPINTCKTICIGGIELVPPITVAKVPKSRPSELETEEEKKKILDKRLNTIVAKEPNPDLYDLFFGLSMLIQSPSTKEKELHKFILQHPISLDTYNFNILSEFRFGNDYRADLVLEYKFNDKRIVFVELEKASLPIFTKAKRETYHVNHAIQQVGDWLRWCRENPNQIPKPLDSSLPMEGLVVIGRSLSMSEDDKKILLHNNQNRLVKVITYDDLLSRIEALIYNLEDNS
jgi:hypothetical protein